MPVRDYGVVIGQFDHFDRDDANHFGSFFHGHIFVRVGSGAQAVLFNCAADVKFPSGMVEYFNPSQLDTTEFTTVHPLADGFHSLAPTPNSGALGGIRRIYVFGAHLRERRAESAAGNARRPHEPGRSAGEPRRLLRQVRQPDAGHERPRASGLSRRRYCSRSSRSSP